MKIFRSADIEGTADVDIGTRPRAYSPTTRTSAR